MCFCFPGLGDILVKYPVGVMFIVFTRAGMEYEVMSRISMVDQIGGIALRSTKIW